MTRFVGIDPSTKTGIVVMDENGEVLEAKELYLPTGINSTPAQLQDYGRDIAQYSLGATTLCIEGFSFGSKGKGVSTQYGVGFAIRFALRDLGVNFIEPTPSQVKKFATGKGNTPKDNMVLPIFKHWGFDHKSDNVRDAFVLAQIARSVRMGTFTTKYQEEVIQAILTPDKNKKKTKAV
ncbi:Crossover junction endodeoxyribonuclease RuvC [compost metagenome]